MMTRTGSCRRRRWITIFHSLVSINSSKRSRGAEEQPCKHPPIGGQQNPSSRQLRGLQGEMRCRVQVLRASYQCGQFGECTQHNRRTQHNELMADNRAGQQMSCSKPAHSSAEARVQAIGAFTGKQLASSASVMYMQSHPLPIILLLLHLLDIAHSKLPRLNATLTGTSYSTDSYTNSQHRTSHA